MIPPVFKFLPKQENMESIYLVCLSSKLAIKTLAGWGKKNLDILFSCNMRTGFSDRNSGKKLCAVSIAINGISPGSINCSFPFFHKFITLLHSDKPKLYTILVFPRSIGLNLENIRI